MNNIFFEILRPGINTTIQDSGRNNLYHIGVTISGAMDQWNYKIANALVGNPIDNAVIEFAYQGPLLKLKNGSLNFAITGDVFFNIIRKFFICRQLWKSEFIFRQNNWAYFFITNSVFFPSNENHNRSTMNVCFFVIKYF